MCSVTCYLEKMKTLFLFTVIVLIASVLGGNDPVVSWPSSYIASGTVSLPYAEITEPFTMYMDGDSKMGKMVTYDGMATMIYHGNEGSYGTLYKLVPETINDTKVNFDACFKLPGVKEAPVVPQTVLPDISLYKYLGNMTLGEDEVMVFYSNFTENNKDNRYDLIVKSDMTPYSLSFVGYDRLFGSHYDEYIITYTEFYPTKPDPDNFKVPNSDDCTGFPGPGVANPMSESIFFELLGAKPYKKAARTQHIETAFSSFKDQYSKKYTDELDEAKRKQYFHHNFRFVKSTNMKKKTYNVALNHLADLSSEELRKMRGYRNTGFNAKQLYVPRVKDIPSSINWRLRGAVTPVKDQGICGSCWSFGTTGTLEGSLFLKHGKLISLSEQAFVDCSWGQGNNGCDGGESERAYEWMLLGNCLPTEYSYGPYLMQDGYCHSIIADCGASITQYYNVKSGDIAGLKATIFEKGPISVAIDASLRTFSFYANGVYYDSNCGNTPDDLDHQVLAVGYGVLNNDEYWLVKNSWSTHWGMDGYVLMSTRNNNCGVATDASFADIA